MAITACLIVLLALAAGHATAKTVSLSASTYRTLLVSGQKVGPVTFGLLKTHDYKPIFANNWEAGQQLDVYDISQAPDHTAFVQVGKEMYATIITDFYPPSTSFLARLSQDSRGRLSVKSLRNVDWSAAGGIWLPCSGDVLQLSKDKALVLNGEEYETNARHIATSNTLAELRAAFETDAYFYGFADVANFMRYFGKYPFANNYSLPVLTFEDIKTHFNPYLYGYITALELSVGAKYKASKYMTMGRFSHEFGYVMPDRRTVYLTDDHGSGGGIFKFVASKASDFSAGKLYAMKATQTSPANGPANASSFAVDWVLLGSDSNAALQQAARKTTFLDIFEVAAGNAKNGTCPPGNFTAVNTATGFECLKLKTGMETHAAFFETRRYAAMLGATTEWSKAEGMAYDAASGSLYLAMSVVRYGMEDFAKRGSASTSYDAGGPNHLRVKYNACGCIYRLAVDAASYSATSMTAALCGEALPAKDAAGNTCDPAAIAAPDNLDIVDGQLIIAEDSEGAHVHSVLWSLDLKSKALTRIFSMPTNASVSYAEFTSSYGYSLGSYRYLVNNVNNWDFHMRIPGRVGYFGPYKKGESLSFGPETVTLAATNTSSTAAGRRRAVELLGASAEMVAVEAARGRGISDKSAERGWPEFDGAADGDGEL